jgi:hypothetical protein
LPGNREISSRCRVTLEKVARCGETDGREVSAEVGHRQLLERHASHPRLLAQPEKILAPVQVGVGQQWPANDVPEKAVSPERATEGER